MKTKRIISALLSLIMLCGAFAILTSAEEEPSGPVITYNTSNLKPTLYSYYMGQVKKDDASISTPEDKLATMDLRLEEDGHRLYIDAYSGEIALENIETGELLFSNPYDIGTATGSSGITPVTENVKQELLSQIVINYTEISTGTPKTMYSFTDAALNGQVVVKNIRNGIRVEYTIGRMASRILVPVMLSVEDYDYMFEKMKENIVDWEDETESFKVRQFGSFYTLKDPEKVKDSEQLLNDMYTNFPITKKMPVYVLDGDVVNAKTPQQMLRLEQTIKQYFPDYTYEALDEMHAKVEYESTDKNLPVFKLALEYSLDETGLIVRQPANGLRFNEAIVRVDSYDILPYMGAGKNPNEGYTFFPDGSGALFDFQKIALLKKSVKIAGTVYGNDFAYHDLQGTYEQTIRYPVFGVVEKQSVTRLLDDVDEDGTAIKVPETEQKMRGFVAMIVDGDALMKLTVDHAVSTHKYNTVRINVSPRPKDTYSLSDVISVIKDNNTQTVVSQRKFTGNYRIRYALLTSPEVAQDKGVDKYYETSYVGMAMAYREYLEREGILTRLTASDTEDGIPLFIQTLGAINSVKKVLSVPINVVEPLTTFEDIIAMYDDLSAQGVENINFILNGYRKGGLSSVPAAYNLKWEKAVGGNKGFEELIEAAKEKGFGVFPDIDFAYVSTNTLFDGLTLKKHAGKTIDNRYASRRQYSATKQTFMGYFNLVVSPAYFSHFYEKFTENYLKYDPVGIAVSTLGYSLNSDFDEDEPYNREDAKSFTAEAFAYLAEKYSKVLTSGGNAYTWKYLDYVTDIALDSSRFNQASASVPFLGIVLHGYIEYTGTPINMEGNLNHAFLKALENGSGLYFTLAYRNTEKLKESDYFSTYYSVRYDIWFDDIVRLYSELNGLLKDVQYSSISAHKFLAGERVPDYDELLLDAHNAMLEAIKSDKSKSEQEAEAERAKLLRAKQNLLAKPLAINETLADIAAGETEFAAAAANVTALTASIVPLKTDMDAKKVILDATAAEAEDYDDKKAAYDTAKGLYDAELDLLKTAYSITLFGAANKVISNLAVLKSLEKTASEDIAALDAADPDVLAAGGFTTALIQAYKDARDTAAAEVAAGEAEDGTVDGLYAKLDEAYEAFSALALPDVTVDVFARIVPEETEEPDETETPDAAKPVKNKYEADANTIAYVAYENGAAFLLNFNNYTVVTKLNGKTYTIEAFGYLIVSASN